MTESRLDGSASCGSKILNLKFSKDFAKSLLIFWLLNMCVSFRTSLLSVYDMMLLIVPVSTIYCNYKKLTVTLTLFTSLPNLLYETNKAEWNCDIHSTEYHNFISTLTQHKEREILSIHRIFDCMVQWLINGCASMDFFLIFKCLAINCLVWRNWNRNSFHWSSKLLHRNVQRIFIYAYHEKQCKINDNIIIWMNKRSYYYSLPLSLLKT